MKRSLIAAVMLASLPALATATPIYRAGNTCPTNADVAAPGAPYTTQYTVDDALACVFETDVNGPEGNINGTTAEALLYLGALGGWTGLLKEEPDGNPDLAYFTYNGTTGGSFTIDAALAGGFNQFAVGIKDGHNPKWAIFLLPVGDFTSDWGMTEGSLSHFTLWGRNRLTGDPQCAPPFVCGDDPEPVPDGGATLAMLGLALTGIGLVRRKL